MKKIMALIFLLGATASCASIPRQNSDGLQDQLQAENRLIKKNSELALRENEVLKKENAQYKSETEKLNAELQRLTGDIEALNKKYDEDMAKLNDAYENLCNHFTSLELESDEKIQALTESNAALEKRFSDEVFRLNGLLEDQKAAFQSDRDLLKSGYEAKIKGLEEQLSSSARESGEKDKTIESLKKEHQEDQDRITMLDKTVKELNEKIKQGDNKYQDVAAFYQRLQKEIDEKQAVIDQLNAKLNALQRGVEHAPGQ